MTENINPTAKNNTTNGSRFNPCVSSVKSLSIVAEEPPAPADLVDKGAELLARAFLSAAFFLLATLLKPPGAADDDCMLVSVF